MSDQRAWNIDARDAMVQLMHRSPQNRKSVLAAVIPISYERIGNEPDRYPAGHTQVFAIEQSVRPQPFSAPNMKPTVKTMTNITTLCGESITSSGLEFKTPLARETERPSSIV